MLSRHVMYEALVEVFEISPVAICISTADFISRYIMANPAYLAMIGRSWEEIAGQPIYLDTVRAVDDPARLRRLQALATVGVYRLEELELRHSSGRIIPTLVSTQRRTIDGQQLDIEIIIDNSDQKALEQAILEAAYTDVVTKLPNRAAFDRRLRATLAARAPGGGIGLAYIDLNGFKAINDRYGHSTGDRVLGRIAERLRAFVSPQHFVARIGGDEFVLLCSFARDDAPDDSVMQAVAESLSAAMDIDGRELTVGAAIGVALTTAALDADGLLRHADLLMYAAKATGRPLALNVEWIDDA